ncbi:MAG: signal peptidase I [Actinobacteria bacterium]|nr:signal peptidase I [Actinomycetota bacterium]
MVNPTLPTPFTHRVSRRVRWLLAVFGAVVAALGLAASIVVVVFDSVVVADDGNAPSIGVGEHVLINTRADIANGDLVAFTRPRLEGLLIGRVVGLPGDRVEWTAGGRQIDGLPAPEPHLDGRPFGAERDAFVLDVDSIFVLADNRDHPTSQFMGTVRIVDVQGVVSWRVWPPSRL